MIDINLLFSFLKENKIKFFSGVPDSILKETKEFFEKMTDKDHIVAVNEGVATSLCVGNHLATGNLPCVYLQNSGLGNAINPLVSIAHKKVYSIPLLLLIGWRGAPGIKDEPQHILDMYGTQGGDGTFGSNCLLARRLAERGTRFIQLYHRDWDHHGSIKSHVAGTAAEVDRGVSALIQDLKQRDMLDDTIIVFGSEFGRTPMAQGSGRDHHLAGFTMWMAGGGFKGGMSYGATDDLGYHAAVDRVSVHDLHATLLHQLGIDHARFSVKFQGLDSRLTGVEPARIVTELLS